MINRPLSHLTESINPFRNRIYIYFYMDMFGEKCWKKFILCIYSVSLPDQYCLYCILYLINTVYIAFSTWSILFVFRSLPHQYRLYCILIQYIFCTFSIYIPFLFHSYTYIYSTCSNITRLVSIFFVIFLLHRMVHVDNGMVYMEYAGSYARIYIKVVISNVTVSTERV